jgi:hypothetical protein
MLLLLLGLTFTPIKEVHVEHLEINRYPSGRQAGVGNPWITNLVALNDEGEYVASLMLEDDAPEIVRSPLIVEHFGTLYKIHFKRLTRTWSAEDPFAKCLFGKLFK